MYKILVQLDPKTPYFTPHSFRHTFLENTTNGTHYICEEIGRALTMEEAQLLAHHKSIDMTKSYLKPKDNVTQKHKKHPSRFLKGVFTLFKFYFKL